MGKRVLPFRVKRAMRSAAFEALDLRCELTSGLQVRVASQSDWAIYNEVFGSGDYDPAILMGLERAGETGQLRILDLGANVGFFTLRCVELSRRQPRPPTLQVTAIEGNPNCFRELTTRLCRDNHLTWVTPIHGLVGERSGTAAISDLEFSGQNEVGVNPSKGHFLVDYVDLEKALGAGGIGLLKCDIEGSELVFLHNYPELLQRTEVAVLELHHEKCERGDCIALLRAAGLVHQNILMQTALVTVIHFWR